MADYLESHQTFPVFSVLDGRRKSRVERCLSVFADVRAGEAAGALLLAANVFVLLASYYIVKTVREALILTEGGAEVKSYSAAGQALLLLLIVPAYGALASRVVRVRLISWVTLFFVSNLVVFFLLGMAGVHFGIAFYLWVGIFSVLVISQFWAFANDLYDERKGKRLFPIIGVGSSLGAVAGARLATVLFSALGPYNLMLLASVLLAACIGLTWLANRREAAAGTVQARVAREPLGKEGGFRLVLRSPYLLSIAALIVLLNIVNTSGEFILSKLVVAEAGRIAGTGPEAEALRGQFIGSFYGSFFTWVNLLGLLFQLFLVSRLFRYIGVRGALFVLPMIAMGGYTALLSLPMLGVVRVFKILENSTDYSVQNTARQALFLPTSREAKYKAKAAIDTFFMRFGDVLQAGVVFLGTQLAFGIQDYAALNLGFVAVWFGIVALIYRQHKQLSEQKVLLTPPDRRGPPDHRAVSRSAGPRI